MLSASDKKTGFHIRGYEQISQGQRDKAKVLNWKR